MPAKKPAAPKTKKSAPAGKTTASRKKPAAAKKATPAKKTTKAKSPRTFDPSEEVTIATPKRVKKDRVDDPRGIKTRTDARGIKTRTDTRVFKTRTDSPRSFGK